MVQRVSEDVSERFQTGLKPSVVSEGFQTPLNLWAVVLGRVSEGSETVGGLKKGFDVEVSFRVVHGQKAWGCFVRGQKSVKKNAFERVVRKGQKAQKKILDEVFFWGCSRAKKASLKFVRRNKLTKEHLAWKVSFSGLFVRAKSSKKNTC